MIRSQQQRLVLLLFSCFLLLVNGRPHYYYSYWNHVGSKIHPEDQVSKEFAIEKDHVAFLLRGIPRGGGSQPNIKGKAKAKPLDLSKVAVPRGQVSIGRILEFHKIAWLPFALYCAIKLGSDSNNGVAGMTTRASLLAGLFGGYGIIWVLKSYAFWDKTFYNEPRNFAAGPLSFLFFNLSLVPYLLYPITAARNTNPLSGLEIVLTSVLFTAGVFFHYAADAQKFFTLQYRGGLITDGLFARCRNPSYFGEWLIWIAFTIVAGYTQKVLLIPNLWFALVTIGSAYKKDESLSRYAEFEAWKQRTWLLFPKLF